MANNAVADSVSAALNSNLSLQSELRSRLVDVRRMRIRNRHDAAAVLSLLSLIWSSESGTSMTTTSLENVIEIPLEFQTEFQTKKHSAANSSKNETHVEHECIGSNSDSKNELRHCSNRAWTEKEIKQLQNVVNLASKKISKQAPEIVASKFKIPSRSARECHVAFFTFADPTIVTSKFTKIESRLILDIISELGGGKDVDWFEIASKLNEKLYPSRQQRRTPWQCFKHYQSTLTKTALPWSSDEDALFIKYLAAHGPQFLFQGEGLAQTNGSLFPYRNPNKVSIRTHTTLLNPNYVHDWWTKDEERKLALLMRAYSNIEGLKQASQGGHFPHRAQALVSGKWNRSICPEMQQMRKAETKTRRDEVDIRKAR